jgi:replication-associated recombination protein RarA
LWGLREQEDNFGTNYSPESKRPFYILSAINSGVKDIRDVIEKQNKAAVFLPQRIRFSLLTKSIDSANRNRIRYLQQ